MTRPFTDHDVQTFFDRANFLGGCLSKAVALYDDWAPHYDATLEHFGRYLSPARITGLVQKHRPEPSARVLDVACGTGRVGAELAARGYSNLTGIDLSAGMLAKAAARGCYQALVKADFAHFDPGKGFDIVVSAGVLTMGHLGAAALEQMVASLAPGGLLVADIEEGTFRDQGIAALLDHFVAESRLARFTLDTGHFYECAADEPIHGRFLTAQRP